MFGILSLKVFDQPKHSTARRQMNVGHAVIMIQSSSTLMRNIRGLLVDFAVCHSRLSFADAFMHLILYRTHCCPY